MGDITYWRMDPEDDGTVYPVWTEQKTTEELVENGEVEPGEDPHSVCEAMTPNEECDGPMYRSGVAGDVALLFCQKHNFEALNGPIGEAEYNRLADEY